MKKELEKKLKCAFPLLYRDMWDSNPHQSLMCFGLECGSGWFQIIWDLSEKLEKLILNIAETCSMCGNTEDNHNYDQNGIVKFCHDKTDKLQEFSSWRPDNLPAVSQVKEKYGTLRFYMTHSFDEIEDLISEAETKSETTCEECGKPGNLSGDYWIKVRCKPCLKFEQESDDKRFVKSNN